MVNTQELPLDVSVVSNPADDHLEYTLTTNVHTTENSFEVAYRYSEFVDFRHKVTEHWTCHRTDCEGACTGIREYMSAHFPKKGFTLLKISPHTATNREQKFHDMLVYLLQCVLLPGITMMCFHAQEQLPKHLFAFLGVTDEEDECSLLQVSLDNYRVSFASSINEFESCTICQDDVALGAGRATAGTAQSPIRLPCGHIFHRDCIVEWLVYHSHCPLCEQHPQSKAHAGGMLVNKSTQHYHPQSRAHVHGDAVSHMTHHLHPQSRAHVHGVSSNEVTCHLHPQSRASVKGKAADHAMCSLHHQAKARAYSKMEEPHALCPRHPQAKA